MMQKTIHIKIAFVLDEAGKPSVITQGGLTHYRIVISIANPPEDVYSVQYQLDPSYINSFRIEDNKSEKFAFQTTAYGDYSLTASLLGRQGTYLASCIVSKALKGNYNNPSGEIQSALKAIADG